MKYIPCFFVAVLASLNVDAQIVNYDGTVQDGMQLAKDSSRNVFVYLTADWCAPCKHILATGFKDKRVGEIYNENYVTLVLDGEKGIGRELYEKYEVNSYPTFLFLTPDGKLIRRIGGLVGEPEDWMIEIHSIVTAALAK